MSFIDQIIDLLAEQNSAMHVDEIAEKMLHSDADTSEIKVMSKKIAGTLGAHVRSANSRVIKATRDGRTKGVYRVRKARVKAPDLPFPDVSDLTTNYIGMAGEYAVMSELLFWGFNVSLMAVDEGIDVIASRNNKYFHIQVKTTGRRNPQGAFSFGIERKKFERNNAAHTFYILVMRDSSVTRFVVLPSSEISRQDSRGYITGVNTMSLKISVDPVTKHYTLNGGESIQLWINGFQFIK